MSLLVLGKRDNRSLLLPSLQKSGQPAQALGGCHEAVPMAFKQQIDLLLQRLGREVLDYAGDDDFVIPESPAFEQAKS